MSKILLAITLAFAISGCASDVNRNAKRDPSPKHAQFDPPGSL